MPAMKLDEPKLDALVAYLQTLRLTADARCPPRACR